VHAVEHLRRNDRRLLQFLTSAHDSLLLKRYACDVDFDAEVPPRDHDAVGLRDDFF
jgi:hypothetical protein